MCCERVCVILYYPMSSGPVQPQLDIETSNTHYHESRTPHPPPSLFPQSFLGIAVEENHPKLHIHIFFPRAALPSTLPLPSNQRANRAQHRRHQQTLPHGLPRTLAMPREPQPANVALPATGATAQQVRLRLAGAQEDDPGRTVGRSADPRAADADLFAGLAE